jgi:hypothetical protein
MAKRRHGRRPQRHEVTETVPCFVCEVGVSVFDDVVLIRDVVGFLLGIAHFDCALFVCDPESLRLTSPLHVVE